MGMTIEELRDYVDQQRSLDNIPYHVYSALIDGIDTLEQEPTTKNNLGVDCIDKSTKCKHKCIDNDLGVDCIVDVLGSYTDLDIPYKREIAENILANLPSVTPQESKTGHWIANAPQYDMLNPQYICSECGNAHTRTTPYCEMCGAKMVEPQESEG